MEDKNIIKDEVYDLIIIGAGPAGLGASIYASRYKLNNLIIGKEVGGQIIEASEIENWAGEKSISGRELMDKFISQTKGLGAEIKQSSVEKIIKSSVGFEILAEGKKYQSRSIIFALGMKPRRMHIPGEEKFLGKGVSYCATCDAMFFRDKKVAVVGGGDAAAMATIHLSEFANQVYLLHREDVVWNPSHQNKMENNPKIKLIVADEITEITGKDRVESVNFQRKGEKKKIEVQGIFFEIGSVPGVSIAKELGVITDDQDYIKVEQTQATNVENIFAAGDVTTGSNKFRQIITAVAEGAVAAGSVYKKLKLNK